MSSPNGGSRSLEELAAELEITDVGSSSQNLNSVPASSSTRATPQSRDRSHHRPSSPLSDSWGVGGASPYLGAVRAEHVGPAARSLRFALLELPGLRALSSARRANVRSRSGIQKFASEGTKQGRNNHQTTILDFVRPTSHGAPRAGFPPSPTLPCCGTYLQGGNGVDVHHGDSTARYPAHCRDQRTRVTVLKWHGHRAPGLLLCRTWSALSQDGAHREPHIEVQRRRS